MPRVRHKRINPYIQTLMEEKECETLKELSEKTSIPYTTLCNYADIDGSHQQIESLIRDAKRAGKSVEEFMLGLIKGPSPRTE